MPTSSDLHAAAALAIRSKNHPDQGRAGNAATRYGRAPHHAAGFTSAWRCHALCHPQLATLTVLLTYFIFPSFAIEVKPKEKPTWKTLSPATLVAAVRF